MTSTAVQSAKVSRAVKAAKIENIKANSIQMFRDDDNRSKLLNIDKHVWLTEALENRYNKNQKPLLNSTDVDNIIIEFNSAVDLFLNSISKPEDILKINEANTASYFIDPFIKVLLPDLYIYKEYKLTDVNRRLDAVLFNKNHVYKIEDNTNFVFMEYKKASIYCRKYAKNIYDVAKVHGLLQRQSPKSDKLKYVLKTSPNEQMVFYLNATRTISGGNTSAGIATNGLSYYFMIDNGNDPHACNQTWSIFYCLDILEIANEYKNGNTTDANIKLNTFAGLIYDFLSNKKRANFLDWYNNLYSSYEIGLTTILKNKTIEKNYTDYCNFVNSHNTVNKAVIDYTNFRYHT